MDVEEQRVGKNNNGRVQFSDGGDSVKEHESFGALDCTRYLAGE